MNMREGEFELYGFAERAELELFRTLTSISGLGPKTAMGILATVEPQHLQEAVANEDPQALRKVSGLGARTAQRLVVELQGKLDWLAAFAGSASSAALAEEAQALEALLALGYTHTQAKEALKEISKEAVSLQDRVRLSLKWLGERN
jgi:Holliday junction DNA helicase RuvA